jgi:hypothetical protein
MTRLTSEPLILNAFIFTHPEMEVINKYHPFIHLSILKRAEPYSFLVLLPSGESFKRPKRMLDKDKFIS